MVFPDIDPVIFSIGPFAVRWYALAYVVGIVGGIYYAAALAKRVELWGAITPPAEQHIHDFMIWAIIAIIAGGRLGYVLFYNPAFYFAHPDQIFAIWRGGMSFHGGLAGVVAAGIFFARRYKISMFSLGDLFASAAPIGLFFGRIANFINGELWGRVSDVPWAVIFPRGGDLPRHPSQIYEALLEGLALFVLLRLLAVRGGALRRPGMLLGVFLIGYGAARIVVEFFRAPDIQLGLFAGLWTMGMILSLPMVLAGVIFYVRALR